MDGSRYWDRRMLGRRRMLRGAAVGGLGLAGAALIGCGGEGPSSGTAAPAGTAVGGTGGAGPQPDVSESFVLIQTRDATSFDPLASQVATVPERLGLVYPRLVNYTRAANADQADTKQVPSYAVEGFEWAGDGGQLTFKLRKVVKYQNIAPVNGRELNAADVKFSINRYMTDSASTFQARYSDIASIETPDDSTVVFKLKKPSRYVMYALAAEPSFITPPEIAADFKTKIIGPGPFLHEETKQGEGAQFRKNPDFIDAAKIYYNRYQVKVVTDPSTRTAAIKAGQADVWDSGGLTKAELRTAEGPSVKSFLNPLILNNGLWFNMNNPKWKDIRARTAISKAFDRQAILDQVFQSDGSFGGPLPVGFGKWALSDKELRDLNAYKYDPAEAKKLWEAAGKPSQSNQYYIPPATVLPGHTAMAELISHQVNTNLGVSGQFATDDYSVFLPKGYNNKFEDICLFAYLLADPLDQLLVAYYPGGARNGPGLNDPQVAGMLDDLRSTLDDRAAVEKSRSIGKHLSENVLSMSHLPANNTTSIYNAKLRNFLPGVYPYGAEWTLQSWKSK